VFGLLITRPYRLATRGAELTIRGTLHAIEFAGEVITAVALRVVNASHDGGASDGDGPEMTPVTQMPPDTRRPEPFGARDTDAAPDKPPAPESPPAEHALDAEGPASTPEPLPPLDDEPAHVSAEPVLVEEFAEPGVEQGVGAQLRIIEPWSGYGKMKAADIIARLASASREEIAAIELYELSGRNRKSVVAAAQRALKQASPPR
jgi:hypothetical protein